MDNTVGSLSQFQKSVIIGTILGDGYLRIIKGRRNAFLEINHSYKAKHYVDWKYKVLKNITKGKPKARKCNGTRIAYRFYTVQMQELTDMYKKFYENGKKIIPLSLKLNPIILAIWYMDDGSKCRNSDVYLNTQQFNIEHQLKLIDLLAEAGLNARLNKDKSYYRIRFLKSSLPKLKRLISKHIIPTMKYKIEL